MGVQGPEVRTIVHLPYRLGILPGGVQAICGAQTDRGARIGLARPVTLVTQLTVFQVVGLKVTLARTCSISAAVMAVLLACCCLLMRVGERVGSPPTTRLGSPLPERRVLPGELIAISREVMWMEELHLPPRDGRCACAGEVSNRSPGAEFFIRVGGRPACGGAPRNEVRLRQNGPFSL